MQKKYYYQYVLIPLFLILSVTLSAAVNYNPTLFPGTSRYQTPDAGWLTEPNNKKAVESSVVAGRECRVVTQNSGNNQYFVPTRSLNEWSSFKAQLPSGVALSSCWCQNPGEIKPATTRSLGCAQNDITVCIGKGQSYTWSKCDVSSNGVTGNPGYYQGLTMWGVWWLPNSGTPSNVRWGDWSGAQNDNYWGGAGTSVGVGTFQDRSPANKVLMKGPCPTGYHVPTAKEWCDTLVALGVGQTCKDNPGYYQGPNSSIGTQQLGNSAQMSLRYNGNRANNVVMMLQQAGNWGLYWTSTPEAQRKGSAIFFNRTAGTITYMADDRSDGFSVRCMRDAIEPPQ